MKTTIQQNYFDALFFASANSNDKKDFFLRAVEFKILIKLIHYSTNQKNITWTTELISKHTSISIGSVDKGIQRLRQKGYITTSTYSVDTFKKLRTIFINWNKIYEVNNLYLLSLENNDAEDVISIEPIVDIQNEEIVPQIEDNEVLDIIEEDIIEEDNSIEKEKSVFEMSLKELVNSPNSDYLIGTNYVPQALVEFIPLIEGKQGLLNQLIKKYDKESFVYKLREILESKYNDSIIDLMLTNK